MLIARLRVLAAVVLLPFLAAMTIKSTRLADGHTPQATGRSHSAPALPPLDSKPAESPYTLHLGGVDFDPMDAVPQFPGWDQVHDDVPDLHLAQLAGPTQQAWLDAIERAGFQIVQYIHPYTYIVWGGTDDEAALHAIDGVRWVGAFKPAYRVQPEWRNLPEAVVDVKVMMYRGADTGAVIRAMHALGAQNTGRRITDPVIEVAKFLIPGNLLQQAAQVPGVYSIQLQPTDGGDRGEVTDQINANNISGSNLAFPGYLAWLETVGVDGTGVIIANVDGGVQETHPDLINRFIACAGITCSGTSSSHGTHTAGIMAADGSSGTVDSNGFLRGLGVAPGANLVEQVYNPHYQNAGGMLLLMTDSFNNGASLSGNSWGPSGSPHGYDDDTRQVDVGVRDADPDTPGNQPLTYVLSFMNGNGGTSTQGTPDEAKNIFTIGSTKGQNNNGSQITAIDDLSSNTAHGPALDGRTIPHMVAPGCEVDSTYPTNSYDTLCGTSMASPHVSGAVALFVQYYRGLALGPGTVDPSPALVKAAFLAHCHDLAGHLDADGGTLGHPFDSKQGWGRMDLEAVIDPEPYTARYFDQPVVLDNTGEQWSTTLSPVDPSQPMKIMLVWTDAPGHGLGGSTPAWNNNLDLVVEADGNTYRGNSFAASGWSLAGAAADGMNNTEGVFLGPLPPASVTIHVIATNIASDGVPNFGDGTDQDFALVAYNAASQPGFTLSPAPFLQSTCFPGSAEYTVNVGSILDYDSAVTLSASGAPAGTSVTFLPNPVIPGGSTTMSVTAAGAVTPGSYSITVHGVAIDQSHDVNVTLEAFDGTPSAPALLSPNNGATDVLLAPTLAWTAVAAAENYTVQLSRNAAFTDIIETAVVEDTSYIVTAPLDQVAQYWWRIRAGNACGGTTSTAFSFTTRAAPSILLVDDDDNLPDMQGAYTTILDNLGEFYDVWDTSNSDNEPAYADLAAYKVVIWFTGDEYGGVCGPGSAGEAALAQWLDTGGCLFVISQDYFFDRGRTSFMSDYLGVAAAESDVTQTEVIGMAPPFNDLGTIALFPFPFTNWTDIISPDASAQLAFDGDRGNAGVQKDTGTYQTVFLGFPLEAIGVETGFREAIVSRMLDFCAGPPCPADLTGDGVVNVLDLLDMLGAWGPNPGHAADLNGDDVVNVLDLLQMLSVWGEC